MHFYYNNSSLNLKVNPDFFHKKIPELRDRFLFIKTHQRVNLFLQRLIDIRMLRKI